MRRRPRHEWRGQATNCITVCPLKKPKSKDENVRHAWTHRKKGAAGNPRCRFVTDTAHTRKHHFFQCSTSLGYPNRFIHSHERYLLRTSYRLITIALYPRATKMYSLSACKRISTWFCSQFVPQKKTYYQHWSLTGKRKYLNHQTNAHEEADHF